MKKNFMYPFLVAVLILLLGACSNQSMETTTPAKEEATESKEEERTESKEEEEETRANTAPAAQWSYVEETGPEHWGNWIPHIQPV